MKPSGAKEKGRTPLKKRSAEPEKTAVSYRENICTNASCRLRKAGCRGFEGCPGYKGK